MTVSRSELQNSIASVSGRFLELVANYDGSSGNLNTMGVELSGLMPEGYSIGLSVVVELDIAVGVEFGSVHVFQQGSRTHDFKTFGLIADVGTPPISAGVEVHFVKGGGEDLRGGTLQAELVGGVGYGVSVPTNALSLTGGNNDEVFGNVLQLDAAGALFAGQPGTTVFAIAQSEVGLGVEYNVVGENTLEILWHVAVDVSMVGDAISVSPEEFERLIQENPTPPCFSAGTPILLADGTSRAIEDILPGDIIAAFDETDRHGRADLRSATVARLLPGVTEEWIALEDGTRVTPGHRYLTEHGTWATAADLIASDIRAVAADGSFVPLRGALLRATDAGSDAGWVTPELHPDGNALVQPASALRREGKRMECNFLNFIAGGCFELH